MVNFQSFNQKLEDNQEGKNQGRRIEQKFSVTEQHLKVICTTLKPCLTLDAAILLGGLGDGRAPTPLEKQVMECFNTQLRLQFKHVVQFSPLY